MPVGATARWEFVLAFVSTLAVGTGALVTGLMGSSTLVTPGVARATYVGVIGLGTITCATLLLIPIPAPSPLIARRCAEAGIVGSGPLADSVREADRDALYGSVLVASAVMFVVGRLSLPLRGLVAAVGAGFVVGQVSFLLGVHDLRRLANVTIGFVVVAYLGFLLTGGASGCGECRRAPWVLAVTGIGLVVGGSAG